MYNVIIETNKKQYYIKSKFKMDIDIMKEIISEYDCLFFDNDIVINCRDVESINISRNIYLSRDTVELKVARQLTFKYGVLSFR